MDNLITIKQLPIIEEQLQIIKTEIEQKVSHALSMVCTENTIKSIKATRADLNRDFEELESRRKDVKSKIMSPYEQFESVYKKCVTDIFAPADNKLKAKIDEVENGLKDIKKVEIQRYFIEITQSKGIDFLSFEQANVSVTLSASKKSLKEKVKSFVERISDDIVLIGTQPHNDEVFVEYKQELNVSKSIKMVQDRYQAMESLRIKRLERERMLAGKATASNLVDKTIEDSQEPVLTEQLSFSPPVLQVVNQVDQIPIANDVPIEQLYEVTFSVTAPLAELKTLKQFLIDGGYTYESK